VGVAHSDDAELLEELVSELFELEERLLELTIALEDELEALLEIALDELLLAAEHTAPVMLGFSAIPPFLSPCTPKLIAWPG
jgi:hypothetical protein